MTCWFHRSSFYGFSIVFPAPWLAKVESSQKSNGMWFFRHFFAPYLFHRSRNNRRDKLRSKFWREKCSENHISSWWDVAPLEPSMTISRNISYCCCPYVLVSSRGYHPPGNPGANFQKSVKSRAPGKFFGQIPLPPSKFDWSDPRSWANFPTFIPSNLK